MDHTDCIVIGAGVIGLSIARELALAGREVIVLEAEKVIGSGVSARNSGVIHAGLYYPAGLAKARLCVEGKRRLYDFAQRCGLSHSRCGKLVVATAPEQNARLEALKRQGEANGVDDLKMLTASEARTLEPELACVAALLSPSTGIVDVHDYLLALRGEAEAHGAMIAFGTPALSGSAEDDGIRIETGGDSPMTLKGKAVIVAAGLQGQSVARAIVGMPAERVPPLHLAKGNYYSLTGRQPFRRLIYPVPEDGGLGVHVTIDMGGQTRFGPDVEWIDTIDYSVDPCRADAFYAAIRRYWPALPDGALVPAYAGIRPKIERPGGSTTDFLVLTGKEHGVPGLVTLFGIESPGLTASLAIAAEVAAAINP
ncbi:MAG TPA: NAD(P)/FAD-dependent oxidoreductase [Beijerinckiaceae bacterium]|nr:NAD(P)/FAD-dependent oxidoreductase [Beijerinckiaceae bacterium]